MYKSSAHLGVKREGLDGVQRVTQFLYHLLLKLSMIVGLLIGDYSCWWYRGENLPFAMGHGE